MREFTLTALPAAGRGHQRNTGIYRRFGKRGFDILFVIALAPIALPVIGLLWLFVRLDGSAGFYSQPRVGIGGREFKCWKLRSMRPGADQLLAQLCAEDPALAEEWKLNQKLRNDPRVTRAGRLLRASGLDELPQLWNVFLGEMSFVGPRPFLPEQTATYRSAGGRAYFALRPGITGPWQVSGRGQVSFAARAGFDETYARDLCLWRDLGLILRTAFVLLRCDGR